MPEEATSESLQASGYNIPTIKPGLQKLFDNSTGDKGNAVDYVLLHGFNGSSETTWLHKKPKPEFFWPKQLEVDLKESRVFLYGYDAALRLSLQKNSISIGSLAEGFCAALIDERADTNKRPIVFAAHSLGGLVLKRAIFDMHQIVHSCETLSPSARLTKELYESISGLIFFGTPHLGSQIDEKYRVRILNGLVGSLATIPKNLTRALESESVELGDLSKFFEKTKLYTDGKIPIRSFYETIAGALYGAEITTKASANLHYANEDMVPIVRTHEGMVKFAAPDDQYYKATLAVMRRYGQEGLERKSEQDCQDTIPRALKLLSSAKSGLIPPDNWVPAAFQWFIQTPEYSQWVGSSSAAFLWYENAGGTGKTYLFCYLISLLREKQGIDPTIDVVYYLCNISQRNTALQVLQSLVGQIIGRNPRRLDSVTQHISMVQLIPEDIQEYKRKERGLFGANVSLEDVVDFLMSLCMESQQVTYIIVDGIDQIEPSERYNLLNLLLEMWKKLAALERCRTRLLISCRPIDTSPISQFNSISVINGMTELKHCTSSLSRRCGKIRRSHAKTKESAPGTNTWIWKRDEFIQWHRQDSALLWIEGDPGSGKSTLATAIHGALPSREENQLGDRLSPSSPDQKPILVCYFYDANEDTAGKSHERMMCSFLFQILEVQPLLFHFIRGSFGQLRSQDPENPPWTSEVLQSSISEVCSNSDLSIHFLIDAMDESEREPETGPSRAVVITFLKQLCTQNLHVKGIITSRPDTTIREELEEFSHLQHLKMQERNHDDIAKIVEGAMLDLEGAWNSSIRSDVTNFKDHNPETRRAVTLQPTLSTLCATIQEYILANHKGIILWVTLVLKDMQGLLRKRPSLPQVKKKLEDIPPSLKRIYAKIVESLLSRQGYGESDIAEARRMLQWTTFTDQGLTSEEFLDAIALSSEPETMLMLSNEEFDDLYRMQVKPNSWALLYETIFDTCSHLITWKSAESSISKAEDYSPNDVIQLLHKTTKDFLISSPEALRFKLHAGDCELAMISALCHYIILSICNADILQKPISYWDPGDYAKLICHLENRPLLSYALKFVPRHIRKAQESYEILQNCWEKGRTGPVNFGWLLLAEWYSDFDFAARTSPTMTSSNFRITCLVKAIERSSSNGTQVMIALKTRVDTRSTDGSLPLVIAAKLGLKDTVDVLIGAGANVEASDISGVTPLQAAVTAKKNSAEIIESLVRNGARLVKADGFGETAISRAVESGLENIVGLLLDRGADNFVDILAHSRDSSSPLPLKAIMDTGTPENYISSAVAQRIGTEIRSETNPQTMTTLNGSTFTSGGLVELTWSLHPNGMAHQTTFYVMSDLSYDIILGSKFLANSLDRPSTNNLRMQFGEQFS